MNRKARIVHRMKEASRLKSMRLSAESYAKRMYEEDAKWEETLSIVREEWKSKYARQLAAWKALPWWKRFFSSVEDMQVPEEDK